MAGKIDNLDSVLRKCICSEIGELVITDTEWNILYRSMSLPFDDDDWNRWREMFMDEPMEDRSTTWEISDSGSDSFYNVRSFIITDQDNKYIVNHIYDISDYADLFRDLSRYSREFKELSACQSELVSSVSSNPSDCIPIAGKYYGAREVSLYIQKGDRTVRHYLKEGVGVVSEIVPDMDDNNASGQILCCSGEMVTGEKYALYVDPTGRKDSAIFGMFHNFFKLYIENALLAEKIVYENEHDHLTGLYNKGRFMEMSREVFPFCKSLAVYYLDVNYLKRTNDTMGHEAGNQLLIKAGDSMKAISADNIYAFRTGGDEFAIVAADVEEDEAERIMEDWKEQLRRLNELDPVPECVIACGMSYGRAPFDLNKLCADADQLMYADKRMIKISRGDDPDGR